MHSRENRRADFGETLSTRNISASSTFLRSNSVPSLAIVWHDDNTRIGEVAPLQFDRDSSASLSRVTPLFARTASSESVPLLDRHLSRSPIIIEKVSKRKFRFTPPAKEIQISVNGRQLREAECFDLDELGNEILLMLSNSVVLSLFEAPLQDPVAVSAPDYGLLGVSAGIMAIRDAIHRLSGSDLPVLIRGETGTGKELVATALHQSSDRRDSNMIPVNMATLTPSLAAAELFGAAKGAFTGAEKDQTGLFEQAYGGILFLDEVGETPKEVQPMLLRVIENGEYRRLGDDRFRKSNARIIAATDRQLEADDGELSFNQPLLRRLEVTSMTLPPLRKRRCDIGILLCVFLSENSSIETPHHFEVPSLSANEAYALALHNWPGNVRELRNVAEQFRLGQLSEQAIAKLNQPSSLLSSGRQKPKGYADPNTIGEEILLEALDENNWVISRTAKHLNIARTSLYELMRRSTHVRTLADVSDEELRQTVAGIPGDYTEWARHLKVSREALKKRIRELHARY